MSVPMLYPMDMEKQKRVEVLFNQVKLLQQNGLSAASLTLFYAVLSTHFAGVDAFPSSHVQLICEAALE